MVVRNNSRETTWQRSRKGQI